MRAAGVVAGTPVRPVVPDQPRPLETAPVDLAAIAADAVQDARATDPGRPIELQARGAVVVPGDESRLRQVASNLLANALIHTPPASLVEVRVEIEQDRAVLSVADRGTGLTPEEAARVFEPFYRSDPARSRDRGGTGLGLLDSRGHRSRSRRFGGSGRGARGRCALPCAASSGPGE